METKQEILKRNVESVAKCNVRYNVTEKGILKAMDEYAKIKMIEENKSLLEMAKLHMDSRAVLVISERISTLEA